MKLLLLSNRNKLANAFRERGVDVRILSSTDMIVIPVPYEGFFWYDDEKIYLKDYDLCFITSVDAVVQRLYNLIKDHIKVVGNPFERWLLDDKVTSTTIAANAGIPIVPYVFGKRVYENHRENLGDKVVVKPTDGSNGIDVELHEGGDLGSMQPRDYMITQKYIECGASDQRWICVGGKIVLAMRRSATRPGEFRANLSQGGMGEPLEITEDMQSFAARILDLFPGHIYCGLDIITDEDGNRYFLECNMNPGNKISKICSHNYYNDLADYILKLYQNEQVHH